MVQPGDGAWAGGHGATNDAFPINGAPSTVARRLVRCRRAAGRNAGQAAERGGRKVVQIEWAGGASASIDRADRRLPHLLSGRGVATNYIEPDRRAARVASFGLQFDHPAGFAGQPPFPARSPVAAAGWTNVPLSYSPAMEMRMRVLDFGVDKYGLNAYCLRFDRRWRA